MSQETWREAILRACDGVPAAERERERVLRAAIDAGFTVRTIARVVREHSSESAISGSTIWRWAGGKEGAGPLTSELDQLAVIPDV